MISKKLADELWTIEVEHILPNGKIKTRRDIEKELLDIYFPDRDQYTFFFDDERDEQQLIEEAYKKQNLKIGFHKETITSLNSSSIIRGSKSLLPFGVTLEASARRFVFQIYALWVSLMTFVAPTVAGTIRNKIRENTVSFSPSFIAACLKPLFPTKIATQKITHATDADIIAILMGTEQALPGLEPNRDAAAKMEEYLEMQHRRNLPTSMADVQSRYQAIPYGWREIDIAAVAARLIYEQKVTIKYAGNTIQPNNQIANYVYTQSEINVKIKDTAPCDYMKLMLAQVAGGELAYGGITDPDDLRRNLAENCIPEGFETMDIGNYAMFLESRRTLMARYIRDYYRSLD